MVATEKKAAAKAPAATKTKKDKAGGKLKRPLSAFMFFSLEARNAIRSKDPQLKMTEISKKVGQQWKALDDTQKDKYAKLAREAKEKYEAAKAAA